MRYAMTDLIRVVIGRESDKEDVKVTLFIDPYHLKLKAKQEIIVGLYFESSIFAYNFIELIRKLSEKHTNSLIEYQRRGINFIQEQCYSIKVFGRAVRNLR